MSFIGQKSGALSRENTSSVLMGGVQATVGHLAQTGLFDFVMFTSSLSQ